MNAILMPIMRIRWSPNRRWIALTLLLGLALLAPPTAAACELIDPGCYIDAFAHDQIHELSLSVWQINRAGLILARWIEDLRGWLIESMLVNAFDSLKLPAVVLFHLALIVAWMVFVISYMVQSLIDLRWVDLRRAMRPILLAFLVYQLGGALLKQSEHVRQIGGSLLQQAGQAAMQTAGAPPVPTKYVEGRAEIKSIYSVATCVTAVRPVNALALNDYAAHYLLATGDDIHCADLMSLAQAYRTEFFSTNNVADVSSDTDRKIQVSQAAQGALRQITGLFMTGGAIIEQVLHLLFALALALVWFGLLISLVFAVFLPSETLFAQQLRAMLAVLRASWLASLLLGIGLAALRLVADTGNGLLMLVGGLMLIAMCLWQGRQALAMIQLAGTSASAALGGAPQAVGGMLRSWATTGTLVAGAAAAGGMGSTTAEIGAALARRLGRNAGDNPLARAAGRVLSRRVAQKLETLSADRRIEQEVDLSEAEAAWYERAADAGLPHAPKRARMARQQARKQRALLLDRHAARAQLARNFARADRLRTMVAALRMPERRSAKNQEPRTENQEPTSRALRTMVAALRMPERRSAENREPRTAALRIEHQAPGQQSTESQEPRTKSQEPTSRALSTAHQAPEQQSAKNQEPETRNLRPEHRSIEHREPQQRELRVRHRKPTTGAFPGAQHTPEGFDDELRNPGQEPNEQSADAAGQNVPHGRSDRTHAVPTMPGQAIPQHQAVQAGAAQPPSAPGAHARAPMQPMDELRTSQQPRHEHVPVDVQILAGRAPMTEHSASQVPSAQRPSLHTSTPPAIGAAAALAAQASVPPPPEPAARAAAAATPAVHAAALEPTPQPFMRNKAAGAAASPARPGTPAAAAAPSAANRARAALASPSLPSVPEPPASRVEASAPPQPWKRRQRGSP